MLNLISCNVLLSIIVVITTTMFILVGGGRIVVSGLQILTTGFIPGSVFGTERYFEQYYVLVHSNPNWINL